MTRRLEFGIWANTGASGTGALQAGGPPEHRTGRSATGFWQGQASEAEVCEDGSGTLRGS